MRINQITAAVITALHKIATAIQIVIAAEIQISPATAIVAATAQTQ